MAAVIISWIAPGGAATYNLTSGAEGVQLVGDIQGLGDLPFQAHWRERIGHGDRWTSHRYHRRPLRLTVGVGQGVATEQAWRDLDAAWWRGLRPDAIGFLDVRTDPANHRVLLARLERASDPIFKYDPGFHGYAIYEVTLAADDPFWRGDDISHTWNYSSPGVNFYGGGVGTLGPPLHISGSGGFGPATIANPGDEPAWPLWQLKGPFNSADVTVDGHLISVPFAMPAGFSVYLDTGPPNGPNVFGDFLQSLWAGMTGPKDFAPVPSGAAVPVTAQLHGAAAGAQAKVTITPRYRRAW